MDKNFTILSVIVVLVLFSFVFFTSFLGYQADIEREKTKREYIKLGYHECNEKNILTPNKTYWSKDPCK